MNKLLAENLYKALKQVKRTKIHPLPVLNHAKLEFSNGELTITTTDLDEPITVKCPCILNEEWSTCVLMVHKCDVVIGYYAGYGTAKTANHKLYPFLDYIKVMAEDKAVLGFEFIENTETMIITSGRSRTEFKCLDALEFPSR